jgi:hypothetical protein
LADEQAFCSSPELSTPALKKFADDSDDPSGRFLDLGEFAEKYLCV